MQYRKLFRERLASRQTIFAAGAYDALSARLIEAAGFDAVMTSGFGVSASFLGQPDVELYTMTENLAVVRQVVSNAKIPVVADCDTGYGNAVNVMRTVREFEQAGVSAVILEDQVTPKRCPCIAPTVEVIPVEEGVAKIKAAVEARRDPDLVIIARTDADSEAGAIERARAYVAAGADMVQPISKTMKDGAMLRRFKAAANVPVSLQVLGWLERDLSTDDLKQIAGLAVFPLVPLMTVAEALMTNLKALAEAKSSKNLPLPRMDHNKFTDFLDFEAIVDIQRRLLPGSELVEQRKAS
jgi:2-methylisocitrate lyase-like PEP mutase family enzyme